MDLRQLMYLKNVIAIKVSLDSLQKGKRKRLHVTWGIQHKSDKSPS